MVSKVALVIVLGSGALHVIIAFALIYGMGPLPRSYDSEQISRLFRGRNGRLLVVAACNGVVTFVGLAVFALARSA